MRTRSHCSSTSTSSGEPNSTSSASSTTTDSATTDSTTAGPHNKEGERGAALIEFSVVIGLLMLLLTAIITYGVLLSYRQVLTQAATDGARAASITVDDPNTIGDERVAAARAALDESLDGAERTCLPAGDDSGLTCTVTIGACPSDASIECVHIELVHNNETNPVVAEITPFNKLTPDEISISTVAIVNS